MEEETPLHSLRIILPFEINKTRDSRESSLRVGRGWTYDECTCFKIRQDRLFLRCATRTNGYSQMDVHPTCRLDIHDENSFEYPLA